MSIIKLFFLQILVGCLFCFQTAFSQEINEPSYKLEFLKATYKDFKSPNLFSNEIILYFKYSKKEGDKTLMSMRIKYKFDENGVEIIENIEKSKHNIVVYGNDNIKKKSREVYDILKNHVEFKTKEEFFIFAFHLRDITNSYIQNMNFAYGLWEPLNSEIRIENYFKINIEN